MEQIKQQVVYTVFNNLPKTLALNNAISSGYLIESQGYFFTEAQLKELIVNTFKEGKDSCIKNHVTNYGLDYENWLKDLNLYINKLLSK